MSYLMFLKNNKENEKNIKKAKIDEKNKEFA